MVIAVTLLWIVVIALVAVVVALARQIGVLHERIAPAGALMVNQRIRAGDAAPAVTVTTLDGETLTVGGEGQRQLLFYLAPDCPICKSLLPVLRSLARATDDTRVILLSDGDDEQTHRAYVKANELDRFPYALSEIAGRTYGVGKLPYAVLVDAAGKVVSLGIVNSREHLESLFESERLGVASIQDYLQRRQGSPVETYDPAGH
ncbi:MAG: redoxin domain-containing protein [Pseudomonadales bacterium]|nr:redoxin domain-containing protein [Pseudomonadales bacterium]MCP5182577.1 redoxin domain-containing protein [Pseudomonadales bacterium]